MVLDFIENHNLSLRKLDEGSKCCEANADNVQTSWAIRLPARGGFKCAIQQQWQNLSYIHPDIQDMDFQVKLENGKTNIFLDCNGKNEDTFDLNKMVLAPNANVDESKDELYPFFINVRTMRRDLVLPGKKMRCRILVCKPINSFALAYIYKLCMDPYERVWLNFIGVCPIKTRITSILSIIVILFILRGRL